MTQQLIKKNFMVLAFGLLMALVLMPIDSFAQRGKYKAKGEDTYQRTTTARKTTVRTNTAKNRNYNGQSRATASRGTATTPRSTTRRTTAIKRDKVTANRRTTRNTTKNANAATYRANRANTATTRTPARTATRYNTGRNTRTAPATTTTNYRYQSNERNDYCNTYYRGVTNWNRSFWTSVHYTPSYYDLHYNRFPNTSGLQAQRVRYRGQRYWFYDGIWFKKRFGRYYAVDAPLGISVDYLPIGGETVWYQGERYVIYRGTAYRMLPFGGFQAVQMLRRF